MSNRAGTFAAIVGIVLLLILVILSVLLTSVRTSSSSSSSSGVESSAAKEKLAGSRYTEEQQTVEKKDTRETTTSARPILLVVEEEEEEEEGVGSTGEFLGNEVFPEETSINRSGSSGADILPAVTENLEYVRLLKISRNQYEDPPEEESATKRHHSGHFRHENAEVWDPHPQYEFVAFGRLFRLRLSHDSDFVSPGVKVTHMSENTTRWEHPRQQLGCFYSGFVDGDPASAVTVSLCHGMTGHVRTSNGSYFIKPTEGWRGVGSEGEPLQHAIYRVPSGPPIRNHERDPADDLHASHNCAVIDYDNDGAPALLTDDSSVSKVYVGRRPRERRSLTEKKSLDESVEEYSSEDGYEQFIGQNERHPSFLRNDGRNDRRYYSVEQSRSYPEDEDSEMESDPFVTWRPRRALQQEYFIEIMVVADARMVDYHGSGLINYILVLMSMVSRIYKDPSIGNPISIAVMNIVKTDETFGTRQSGSDGIAAAEMLKMFCHWQKRNNPDEPSPDHHDAALLLTRENLCHNLNQRRCDTLGLAELGRMCTPGSSCAIVQDNGLAAAFTIAHEIGHVLNMPHDDDSKCVDFRNRSDKHNVMSRMLDDNTFPWEWSKCSRHYVTEFLEAGYGNCLLDEPNKMMTRRDIGRLPGEDYTKNRQCELVFGPGSSICPHMVSDVCRRLWCTAPMWGQRQQCHTQHMPWADGTHCGEGKWCHRGECVSRRNLEPVDGQWGSWGPYGPCTRTCGGGIKRRYRDCDNPKPQNGGNYCIGDHVKYRSCGTKDCPVGSPDFREQQCSKFDNNNHNIVNLSNDVKWRAKITKILPEDRCKLYCKTESNQYYMLRGKVIDGTPCGRDTFDICVNGYCKSAGCDHELNSTAELDICGVCKGDNSTCQRITGSYNSSEYGYTRVAKIPAGSNYIDIRQHGWLGSNNDSNYLALRLGEGGEYILNGNYVVMHRKVIVLPGASIEYSGPESVVERLNSSRPISTDLILEILSVGSVYPPQITYEYTVPKRILNSYTWVLREWTNCNRVCQGTKHRKAECRSAEHKEVVPDDYCRAEEKPREESLSCNTHCTLQWQVVSVSECSNHCGPGIRSVTTRCVQILSSSEPHRMRQTQDHACQHLQRPAEREACEGPCKDTHWSYGKWGPCSVTCGGGVQTRKATCVDSNGRPMSEEKCSGQDKHLKRSCRQESCPRWSYGDWSTCSVSCGVGQRQRHYWCHVDNQVVPPSDCNGPPIDTEICEAGPCHRWHAGDWSSCSVTCGEGTRRRKVVCKSTDGSASDSCSTAEKPEDTTVCSLKPCPTVVSLPPVTYSSDSPYEVPSVEENEIDSNGITFHSGYNWRAGSYGECSKACNGGYKSRVVQCSSIETDTVVPDHYCDIKRKPSSQTVCNQKPCSMWNTGEWSQCDAKCGNGYQHRQVRCQSERGEILPRSECSYQDEPRQVKKCQKAPCAAHPVDSDDRASETGIVRKWKVYEWSPCSKSCGSGLKTRRVECTIRRGSRGAEVPVKDEQCSKLGLIKPRSQRPCQRIPCNFTWQEGTWSECSADCGSGVQRRSVSCHRVNRYGWVDPAPSKGCPMHRKPAEEQVCKLRECGDKYYWTAGPWRKCSHPCGRKGRQNRRVFCHERNGRKVERTNCPSSLRPERRRKCNQRRCGLLSCVEVQQRYRTGKDGEYSLLIAGRNMSIYCHDMSTSEPREYLTLPVGDRENYAEIYDKMLKNPNVCPYEGRRNDSCDCVTNPQTDIGRTIFRRIRLDPTNLVIIANDYTFSRTIGEKRIEFGTAGDCYSRVDCPQGRFSINLTGTSLRLSPEVSWRTQKATAFVQIKRISDQRIIGRCGGFCGSCMPERNLKLDVLPP